MNCFCRHNPCVNVVRAYQDCKLIYTKEGYFEVICPPKVCVKQRLILLNKEKRIVRVIIKIFNFERLCFENVHLINELNPLPTNIYINQIDGLYSYNEGILNVVLLEVNDLSVYTIDYLVQFENCINVDSLVYIKDDNNKTNNKNLKRCNASLKI